MTLPRNLHAGSFLNKQNIKMESSKTYFLPWDMLAREQKLC